MKPIQNLNGYSEPWIGGQGTNLLDYASVSYTNATSTGTADDFVGTIINTGNAVISFPLPNSVAGQTVYFSGEFTRPIDPNNPYTNVYIARMKYTTGGSTIYTNFSETYTSDSVTVVDGAKAIPAGSTNIAFQLILNLDGNASNHTNETVTAKNLRLCLTQNQPWSPYENICPIYGHTSATAHISEHADLSDPTDTTVSFGQTVYAGSIDFVSGELTITKKMYTIDGSGTVNTVGSFVEGYTEFWYFLAGSSTYPLSRMLCDSMKKVVWSAAFREVKETAITAISTFPSSVAFKMPTSLVGSDAVSIAAYLQANPIQIVAPLATPATYQLTPQQIETFEGDNYIWVTTTQST